MINRSLISIAQSASSELSFLRQTVFLTEEGMALWRRLLVIGYGAIQYGSTEGCWCESYPRLLGCWAADFATVLLAVLSLPNSALCLVAQVVRLPILTQGDACRGLGDSSL